jgi:hypothetical protein
MRLLAAIAPLLGMIDCESIYRVRPDPSLTVAPSQIATGSQQGVGYRLHASGGSWCCAVSVDILNLGTAAVVLTPSDATLTAQSCSVEMRLPTYEEGRGAKSFAEMQELTWQSHQDCKKQNSECEWFQKLHVKQQFTIPPNGFLQLTYFAADKFWRRECGAYSFALPVGTFTIGATFTEPL